MIEKNRFEFFKLLREDLKEWTAVVFIFSFGTLESRVLAQEQNALIIDSGRKVLASLGEGYFSRISWASFFAVSKECSPVVLSDFLKSIELVKNDTGQFGFWEFSLKRIDADAIEIFTALEISTNKLRGIEQHLTPPVD
jgi:hypothetical protein